MSTNEGLLYRIAGWRCPTRLAPDPFVVRMTKSRHFDDRGYETTKRINGAIQCPHCGLYWPIVGDPTAWVERDGRFNAIEWWDSAECLECGKVFVDTLDGIHELRS